MNNRKKLIELFIYLAIVLAGLILLIASNVGDNPNQRVLYGAALPDEPSAFYEAMFRCDGLPLVKAGIGIPDEPRDYCPSIFGTYLRLS